MCNVNLTGCCRAEICVLCKAYNKYAYYYVLYTYMPCVCC